MGSQQLRAHVFSETLVSESFMRYFILGFVAAAPFLFPQDISDTRNADIRGGGGDGKCTIEVEVDGIAEVEISGSTARIRTLQGNPARFRRFQCNQAMPVNPFEFRFEGVDGRGRQTLVRNPGGRVPAVIRIEDPKSGSEGYTFDVFWRGATGPYTNGGGNSGIFGGGNNGGGFGNGNGAGFGNNGNVNWNRDVNFRGRGDGDVRTDRGGTERLYDCRVTISRRGDVAVRFDTDRFFSILLEGRVVRYDGNRVYATMNANGSSGEMIIDVDNRDRVTNITMTGSGRERFDIRWRN